MTYQTTQQRQVSLRILSFAGWIEGAIRMPPRVSLVDYLNRPDHLYRLVDVKLPGQTAILPFFALTRASTVVVTPMDSAEIPAHDEKKTSHQTMWLLHDGIVIDGSLELLDGVRISDHLAHKTGFVSLRDCTIHLPTSSGPTTVFPHIPFLALQTDRAIGVSEIGDHDSGH